MRPTPQEPLNFGMMVFPGNIASALPLEQTRVNAHITGLISTVTVNQSFNNPFELPIELEYLFPLPETAALIDFTVQIGPRMIHADLRELEQVQEAYEQARQAGKQAAKLDQRRPNLFAIQLANVLPDHLIQVSISYEHALAINADEIEFIFPMGLTPKYHSETQSVESQGVDSPVASPGEKIGVVEIEVTAMLGQKTGDPTSPSHPLLIENLGNGQYTVSLQGQTIPDHDFVLRFPLIEKTIEPAVWCAQDENHSEIVLVNWLPVPNETLEANIQPREFIFVLDRSGSMSGEPIRQARNALRACLRILDPQDTFWILLFDDRLEWYRPAAIQVTQGAIDQADQFLNTIEGRGGTEIVQAVESALEVPVDRERIRYILFLTDGAVSAEDRAFQAIRKKLNQARIFTFGIGSSVNRALLSKMAQLGRGTAEFLQLNEDIEGAILRLQDKVAFPVLTDIQLDWSGCSTWDMIPSTLPDLYAGQSLQLVTRLQRSSPDQSSRLRVTGNRGQEKVDIEIPLPGKRSDMPEVKRAWARARIEELLDQSASGDALSHKVRQEVIGLAIEHRLVTPFTAFIALDPDVVNPKGEMLAVAVAQPLPAGLDRGGFFPPPPVQMASASFIMPAMPRKLTAKQAPDTSARGSTGVNELYQRRITLSDNSPSGVGEILGSPQSEAGRSMILSGSGEIDRPGRVEILRWLARTQKLNGSWSQDVEFTAAALLAFVRQGHTPRRGFYRKQVGRAAEWLLQAGCDSTPAHIRAIALHELATAEPGLAYIPQIDTLVLQLPPALTPLGQIIRAKIGYPEAFIEPPQSITDLESLRIACILKLELPVPAELIKNDPKNLAQVWMACLP